MNSSERTNMDLLEGWVNCAQEKGDDLPVGAEKEIYLHMYMIGHYALKVLQEKDSAPRID